MESRTEIITVNVADGKQIKVEVTAIGGEEDVSSSIQSFEQVTGAIEGIAKSVLGTIERIKPKKAVVEFGLELATESGQLTALLVKGSGKANLKISLEWS